MRIALSILATLIAFCTIATVVVWIHSWTNPDFAGIDTDYRAAMGPAQFAIGEHAWGVYANEGQIGVLYVTDDAHGYETINARPRVPTHFVGNATGFELLQPIDLAFCGAWSRFGLSLYNDVEMGGGTSDSVEGALVNTWIVAVFLAAVFGAIVWRLRRTRRKSPDGLCPRCAYDIRTQLLNGNDAKCPECGTLVHRATA